MKFKKLISHAEFAGFLHPMFFLAIAAMIVETSFSLISPLLTKNIIDDALVAGHHEKLTKLIAYLLCAIIGASFFGLIKNRFTVHLHKDLKTKIMMRLGNHIQKLSIGQINNENSSQYITRMTIDTENLDTLLASGMIEIVRNVFMVIGILIIALKISPFLMLLSCVLIPIVYIIYTVGSRGIEEMSEKVMNQKESITKLLTEDISGVQTIRLNGIEIERQKSLTSFIDKLQHFEAKLGIRSAYLVLSSEGLELAATFIIWGVGGYFAINGKSSIGELVAFSAYLSMVFGPITTVLGAYMGMKQSVASARRVLEILRSPIMSDSPDSINLDKCVGQLDFENIFFKYPKAENWTIQNVNFTVNPRSALAIVGPNGAGKSTLIALLARFYSVDEGVIRLDGIDIQNIRRESLCKHIAIVTQNPFFFDTTIADNIALWRSGTTPEMVIESAKIARAHDFIMALPEQYNTRIGESGCQLSGGQRQRLAIARALVGKPRIIILDETSAHIDEASEDEIYSTIFNIRNNYSLIVITHKLSTLKHIDNVVVVDNGVVKDSGTPEDLVSHSKVFQDLFNIVNGPISLDKDSVRVAK